MYVKYFTSFCGIKSNMKDISKIIGNNIKYYRKLKGLTQTQVANLFRMTQQQYSRFENGIFELNYQQITDICKLLEITPNELFNFDE